MLEEGEERDKFFISVTEEEVLNGVFKNPNRDKQVVSLIRDIQGLETATLPDNMKKNYIDMVRSGAGMGVDTEAVRLLRLEKEKIASMLPKENVMRYEISEQQANMKEQLRNKDDDLKLFQTSETKEGVEYRRQLVDEICWQLSERILQAFEKEMRAPSPLFDEVIQHLSFQEQKLATFVERPEVQSVLKQYLERVETGSHPSTTFVLRAGSGAGKTAMMAWAAQRTTREVPGAVVILRFLGTSPQSTDVLSLLKSVSLQLVELLKHHAKPPSDDINKWETVLREGTQQQLSSLLKDLMGYFSLKLPSRKLYIFLDSLDQLIPANNAYLLFWLPLTLPPRVHFVVSTLIPSVDPVSEDHGTITSSQLFSRLTKLYEPISRKIWGKADPSLWSYSVPDVSIDAAKAILDVWFKNTLPIDSKPPPAGTKVQPPLEQAVRALSLSQKGKVLSAFQTTPTLLYLRVASDLAMTWTSYSQEKDWELQHSMKGIIAQVYQNLEKIHGNNLVGHALGYLVTSRFGLSSTEMEDIISCDEEVLQGDNIFQWWTPPVRKLPSLLWKRLREDLGNYVVEKGVFGVTVHSLYHRQFWETAETLYLTSSKVKCKFSRHLAQYFNGDFSSPAVVPFFADKEMTKVLGAEDRLVSAQPLYFSSSSSSATKEYNRRKLMELPYQQTRSLDFALLSSTLYNFEFIEAKAAAKLFVELRDDYNTAISTLESLLKQDPNDKTLHSHLSQLSDFQQFVQKQAHLIQQSPKDILLMALNGPDGYFVTEQAKEQRQRNATYSQQVC